MVLKRWILVWLVLLMPLGVAAQQEEWLEPWVEETDDAQAAAEMHDQWLELQHRPVNINDTNSLDRLFFLTPFQRQALRNYLTLYGQMMSLKELRFVPGFDSLTIGWLEGVAVADRALLLAALQSALEQGAEATDECAALERMGVRPYISEGAFENIKITTPTDLRIAQGILEGGFQP